MSDKDFDRYRHFFHKADSDNDGKLTLEELTVAISQGGLRISASMIKDIFKEIDDSADGLISLGEFMYEMGQHADLDYNATKENRHPVDTNSDGQPVPNEHDYNARDSRIKVIKPKTLQEMEDELRHKLFDYTEKNDLNQVKHVLQDMNKMNWHPGQEQFRNKKYRTTVLHFALYHSADEVARYFIEHPRYKDVNLLTETCNGFWMPKGEYSGTGDEHEVECCILKIHDSKLRDKKRYNGITCLSILAATDNTKLAQVFFKEVTDLKKWQCHISPHKDHSIHIAAANGHMQFVELLLDKGVDVDCSGPGEWTPIVYAAQASHMGIMEELLKRNADIFRVTKNKTSVCYLIVRYGCNESIKVLIDELQTAFSEDDTRKKHHLNSMLFAALSRRDNEIINIVKHLLVQEATHNGTGPIALHEAAKNGDSSLIECLLNDNSLCKGVDEIDEDGNTALLLASQKKQFGAMSLLVERGASMSHQNKRGISVWDSIVGGSEGFIKNVLGLYRSHMSLPAESSIKFSSGMNPLFIAFGKGKYETLRQLCEHKVDAYSTDENKNTIFHHAARQGKFELFTNLKKYFLNDEPNKYGKTVLEIATEQTSSDRTTLIVAFLLRNLAKSGQDKDQQTQKLLMKAASCGDIRVVHNFSKAIAQLSREGVTLDLVMSKNGNTALHIAAKKGYFDIMKCLVQMNFGLHVLNSEGRAPFFEAMKNDTMLTIVQIEELFQLQGLDFGIPDIDATDTLGNTALHWCTQKGDWRNVKKLILAGADMEKQNKDDEDTPLHLLVQASKKDPGRWLDYEQVLTVYGDLAKRLRKKAEKKANQKKPEQGRQNDETSTNDNHDDPDNANLNQNHKEGEQPEEEERNTMLHLLWDVNNKNKQSVITLALSEGAVDVIDKLLDMQDIFRFLKGNKFHYDITFLTPETMPEKHGKFRSCFDLVIELAENDDEDDNEIIAAKILDTNPFKILIDSYHTSIQYLNYTFAFMHFIHMMLFTIYALPDGRIRNKNSNCNGTVSNTTWDTLNSSSDPMVSSGPRHEWFLFFLIWPTLILVGFLILRLINLICGPRFHPQSEDKTPNYPNTHRNCRNLLVTCGNFLNKTWSSIIRICEVLRGVFLNIVPELFFLAFCLATYCWYFLLYCGHSAETYLEACASVFILGWLATLYFFVSPEQLIFMAIANHIAFRDISRFMFIYAFVLLGFGFAFHTLFQFSFSVADDFESPWNTLLATFNLMVGVSSVLNEKFESNYKHDGGHPAFVYCVYFVYVVVATIIMLNMLIAMLTHSFDSCNDYARILWRVRALKLILNIIRIRKSLAIFSGPWSTHSCKIKEDVANRWMLEVERSMTKDDSSDRSEKLDNIIKVTWRLEQQLDALKYKDDSSDRSLTSYNTT